MRTQPANMRNIRNEGNVPPALHPYTSQLRVGCLVLLTSVLNATNTWLLLRYIDVLLPPYDPSSRHPRAPEEDTRDGGSGGECIILASFLRSWDFWHEGSRRIGRDLVKAREVGELVYIDGLSHESAGSTQGFLYATNATQAGGLEKVFMQATEDATRMKPGTNITFVIDGLDFLLASQAIEASALQSLISQLRSRNCSVICSISADTPLVQSSPQTPLEQDHLSFLTTLAHQANFTLSTRPLSTGAAKDVTGVLQITRGSENIDEKELLYYVHGDGSVDVFERGSLRRADEPWPSKTVTLNRRDPSPRSEVLFGEQ